MRKGLSVLLALTLFLAFPIAASAQGWFGGFLGSGDQGVAPREPRYPSLLRFDVGHLFRDRGVLNDVTVTGSSTFFGRRGIKHEFSLEGLQLGATLQAPVKDNFGILIRGTWLIPEQTKAIQINDDVTYVASREWSTKLQYYTLEAALLYPVSTPFSFVAGLRFDSLITDFSDPVRKIDFSASRRTDRMEHTYNTYIPYAGLAVQSGQALRVWIIGTPTLWGQVKTRETVGSRADSLEWNSSSFGNSYFVECGIGFEMNVFGGTGGVIAKWTSLYTKGNTTFQDVRAGGVVESNPIVMSVRRQNVLLAAQFSVPFTSPW